jgi:hypothetical protein
MEKRRGLLILRGYSFRYKGTTGHWKSIFQQILCTLSHLKLIKTTIKKYGNNFDIALDTFSTPYDLILLFILRKYLVYKNIMSWPDYSQIDGILRLFSQIECKMIEYDFILIARNDIILFDEFINKFNPDDDVIKFPFVHSHRTRRVYGTSEYPIVGDAFMYLPKKYFFTLSIFNIIASGFHMHDIVHMMKYAQFDFEFDFYCNTYHDTNTATEWNPLYRMSGRPHSKVIGSDLNLTYPKDF